jgi:predicted nucleic acid-binding protein
VSVISNTTVLSNFATIEQLDLLHALYPRLSLPTAVYDELQRGLEEGYAFYQEVVSQIFPFYSQGWLHLTNVTSETEIRLLGELPRKIHAGEAECLVIARQRGLLLLTDDRAARRLAETWGIKVLGTLGSLVLLVERNHCSLSQANNFLSQMIQQGYRLAVSDLSCFLP